MKEKNNKIMNGNGKKIQKLGEKQKLITDI